MKIKRMDLVKDDPKETESVIENGTIGQKLGLLRAMGEEHPSKERLGESILTELLSRQRRIDHREHPLMIAYFSQLGFEVAHLKTGDGDIKSNATSVERKEKDFMDSLFDDRWLRQLSAMREEADYSFLIVTSSYDSIKADVLERGISESVLTGFISALCVVGYPPLFIEDRYDMAVITKKIMDKIDDDVNRLYVPRPRSPKPQEYRNAIFEALPKVAIKTRRKLVEKFPSVNALCQATVEDIMSIEGIGEKTARRIHEILHAE